MKKVGLFGGAFDPPHNGHLKIAITAFKQLQLDEVRFIPTNIPPHKQASLATGVDRLEMLKIALQEVGISEFTIDTIELERKGPSYTIDTVKAIIEREPNAIFYFIIGGDMIEYLPKWHRIDELVHCIPFVGVSRPTYNSNTNYPILMLEMEETTLSSSEIRNRSVMRKSLKGYVPDGVLKYMKENGLYGL